ncbi:MAG: hypothetical protein RI995_1430 [Bacteroidota bacterium]
MWPNWDTELLKWINLHHSSFMDSIMIFFSNKYVWIPFYIILIAYIIRKYRTQAWKSILYLIASVAISDQICSSILKPWTQRLRPCHEAAFQSWIHLADGCGGQFGFCSSHAANSFALAIGFYFLTKNKSWLIAMMLWALIISYSRVYLGAHYPIDVIVGAGVGAAVATIFSKHKLITHNS